MLKLFGTVVDYPQVLQAANEEFPSALALTPVALENDPAEVRGWSAYEIWRSRIRLSPGVTSLFLPQH